MKALKRSKVLAAGIAATALALACTAKTAEEDTSNTLLNITNLTSGDGGEQLSSDVCVTELGAFETGCTVISDSGSVTVVARPKSLLETLGATYYNDVVFERYRVTYTRADGRNTPGVDVPYAFDGVMNLYVPINGEGTATFTLVRLQAKLEPPLRNLIGQGGSLAITTLAQVDFYGKDGAGRPVSVTGHITVTFADFAEN